MTYHQVARVFRDGTLTGLSDRQLLERYADRGDEAAFETIVARHGPMVFNVCRQLLRDSHDVDDAFQATFLALIRKAGSIRVERSMGPWLHTVAGRIAVRARANRLGRGVGEPLPEQSTEDRPDRFETSRIVHEELARIPERLRAPIVLCYLEGHTHEMAASQLGCPVGTVRSRLARARAVLQRRMVRRGLSLPAGAVAALLESRSNADIVPLHLRKSLIEVATRLVSGIANGTLAGGFGASTSAVALLEGFLNVMRIKTLTIAAAGLAALGISLAVIGTTAYSVAGPPDEQPARLAKSEERPDPSPEKRAPKIVETFPRTYPVGDLIMSPQLQGAMQPPAVAQTPGTFPDPPKKPLVDMMPLIKLIASTIEPSSWKVFDDQGQDVSAKLIRGGQNQEENMPEPVGSITPFFLSVSIIVRTTAETHEKVSNLLRGLRALNHAKENPGKEFFEEEERLAAVPKPRAADRRDPRVSPTSGKTPPGAKSSGSRAKIEQLLDELRKETSKLPNEPDR